MIDIDKYLCQWSSIILERYFDLTHSLSNKFPRGMKQGTVGSFPPWPTWMLPYSGKATKISLFHSFWHPYRYCGIALTPWNPLAGITTSTLFQYGKTRPTAAALKWKSFENGCNKSWWHKASTATHALWSIPAQWHYSKGISGFCFCNWNRP